MNEINQLHGVQGVRRSSDHRDGAAGVGLSDRPVGQVSNGYADAYVPPGWDRWFATYDGGGFYDYAATDDGRIDRYGAGPAAYGTDLLADRAVAFIDRTPASQPLFLYFFAPHAPHHPATPAPGDHDSFADLPIGGCPATTSPTSATSPSTCGSARSAPGAPASTRSASTSTARC